MDVKEPKCVPSVDYIVLRSVSPINWYDTRSKNASYILIHDRTHAAALSNCRQSFLSCVAYVPLIMPTIQTARILRLVGMQPTAVSRIVLSTRIRRATRGVPSALNSPVARLSAVCTLKYKDLQVQPHKKQFGRTQSKARATVSYCGRALMAVSTPWANF